MQDKPALALEIENAIYDFYQLPHLKKKLAQKTTAKKDTSSFSNSPDVIDSENPNTEVNAKAKAKERSRSRRSGRWRSRRSGRAVEREMW